MFSKNKNNSFYNNFVWVPAVCALILILLLSQGCSSNMESADRIGNPADKQIESIGTPKLVVEKTTYDFGDIKPGSTNTAVFNFTNVGDKPLKVIEVKRCCGAVVEVDRKELAPGESGVLTAQYRTGQVSGNLRKKIGLITNDPDNPHTDLIIAGKVIRTLKWTPVRFEICPFKDDTECPEIKITSLDNTPFAIKGFSATSQCFNADFDPLHEATEFTIRPELDAEKLKALSTLKMRGGIKIDLSHEDYKSIDIGFDVIPSLQTVPAMVLAFNAKMNEPILRPLQLQDNEAEPNENITDRIESVTAKNGTRIDIRSITELQAGCKFNLEIWPSNNEKADSFINDELVIKMKDGRELNVPVHVFYESQTVSSKAN